MALGRDYEPLVTVVGFHHARGPEIETWFGNPDGTDPSTENDWSLLPFMALSDGAHTSTEDFSYFTLRHESTSSSLFGISCTRQIDATLLKNRAVDVTRSTVQKGVVVIIDDPSQFGQLRPKLSAVTGAWFAQRDFTDTELLKSFQESLAVSLKEETDEKEQYLGLSLREMIHEFKHQTLILFKCLLLQPKMLFFGSRCERLCMIQFSLISLIPGLLRSLQDCADPAFEAHELSLVSPTTLRTSERGSLLTYMGLPLQIFGKGAFFGPYTPLQQLDLLADYGTKSYVVGSTNSLLLQQKDRYSDVLINLDESTINITSPSLRTAIALSAADRRWIDYLTQTVNETWDERHPNQPKNHTYIGSEEFIRLQFEEYLLALLSAVKFQSHLSNNPPAPSTSRPSDQNPAKARDSRSSSPTPSALSAATTSNSDNDPTPDFSTAFLAAWAETPNYATFNRTTSVDLFDIVAPRHPCAGGLTIEDVQRRITQQVAELHLDERVREGREVLNKHLATGQKRIGTAFNNLWADIESMREAQRKKRSEASNMSEKGTDPQSSTSALSALVSNTNAPDPKSPTSPTGLTRSSTQTTYQNWTSQARARAPEIQAQAQATAHAASQKASAYISSWSSWASERKKGWEAQRAESATTSSTTGTEEKRSSGVLGRFSSSLRRSGDHSRSDKGRENDTNSSREAHGIGYGQAEEVTPAAPPALKVAVSETTAPAATIPEEKSTP